MGFARLPLLLDRDVRFWKLLGSGVGEGFTPLPNTSVYAVLTVWPDLETARRKQDTAGVFRAFRKRSSEDWTLFMAATSSRGSWARQQPFTVSATPGDTDIVALTRATIRPKILLKFWGRVPGISTIIGSDPNVRFKVGLGELPWFRQITFSIWPDTRSMAEFARRDGPHARAIKAVRDGNWFKEELYARFQIIAEDGHWSTDKRNRST